MDAIRIEAVLIGRKTLLEGVETGIVKAPVDQPVRLTATGLVGDEQADLRVHGGTEKALHHYPLDHYPSWAGWHPPFARFQGQAGAFGENLASHGLVESQVCVGDVFRLGGAVIQVSQARQPCWKLNLRFRHPRFAHEMQACGRTGWYYRVLEEGDIAAGDRLELIDRPRPDWDLARLLKIFFDDRLDREGLEQLTGLAELSERWRITARRRLETGRVEDWSRRLTGPGVADAHRNHLDQPVGAPLPHWSPRPLPARSVMEGRFCRVEPLDPLLHADDLFDANAEDREGRMWTYLAIGPFDTVETYRAWMERACRGDDPLFHAVVDRHSGRALGVAGYLRIDRNAGSIEIGHLAFSPRLQRTAAATEALHLMMRRVFDELGYRRCEWKCDALNAPSRAAAQRFGFRFEGIFRQATLYKGRNRDTAWYSVIDEEWPALCAAHRRWLDTNNFDDAGHQRQALSTLVAEHR